MKLYAVCAIIIGFSAFAEAILDLNGKGEYLGRMGGFFWEAFPNKQYAVLTLNGAGGTDGEEGLEPGLSPCIRNATGVDTDKMINKISNPGQNYNARERILSTPGKPAVHAEAGLLSSLHTLKLYWDQVRHRPLRRLYMFTRFSPCDECTKKIIAEASKPENKGVVFYVGYRYQYLPGDKDPKTKDNPTYYVDYANQRFASQQSIYYGEVNDLIRNALNCQ